MSRAVNLCGGFLKGGGEKQKMSVNDALGDTIEVELHQPSLVLMPLEQDDKQDEALLPTSGCFFFPHSAAQWII